MGVTYNYGAGPTYTKIASQTLGSTTATLTFSNLPQNYTDLVVVLNATTNHSDNGARGFVQFNSETSVYSDTWIAGNGSSVSSSRDTSDTYLAFCVPGNSSTEFGTFILNIQNYSNSTTYKSVLSRSSSTSAAGMRAFVGMYRSTSPITTVTFRADSSYRAGSTFTLYGIAAALKPKATGGTISFDPANSKWIHTFTSSGAFTPTQGLMVDYLVVAGGGGGGGNAGGGGGAGGLRSTVTATGGGGSLESALSLALNTNYTVTVGAGGSGGGSSGTSGSNSLFSTITSTGGGRGASVNHYAASTGGSGGGGNYNYFPTGAAGTANQGYAGGTTNGSGGSPNLFGAGGGGAGAVGGNGSTTNTGGNGGNGVATSITGSSVTYGGGGGGGAEGTAGTGGTGGGGNGSISTPNGSPGTANTGGGGGGGYENNGGNGGSGIVIVRYSA